MKSLARSIFNEKFLSPDAKALLARYFNARGLFSVLDFSAMKEGKLDDLSEAWLALPGS